jgi:3-hydroxyisobutyrate dehydrogenase
MTDGVSSPRPPESIGFIGTGIMGGSMAGHLLAAGHQLHVHSRTRAKAAGLLEAGAAWHDSPAAIARAVSPTAARGSRDSGIVITMLGLPEDVEQVYLGPEGLVAAAAPGSILVDMTTSSPGLAERIAREGHRRDITCLDCPVSGGDIGARNATLVIMAGCGAADTGPGGDRRAFERVEPILRRMGRSVTLLGPAGAGQRCKLANQVAVAVGMVAWCEALAHARAGGLDPAAVQGVIAGGAAGSWALSHLAPRALAGDFAPGFMVRHLVKDIRIALETARETGLHLPGLETAARLYEALERAGHGLDGTQALLGLYAPG